jgi:DNA-binding MarR family transcriptional regulator
MLTPHEARLLASLRRAGGPIDRRGLAARTALPPAHVGRLLADLEWRGLVVVLRAAGGRAAMLTPRGQGVATA